MRQFIASKGAEIAVESVASDLLLSPPGAELSTLAEIALEHLEMNER